MIAMERNEDNLANNNAAVSSDDEDDPLDEGEARLRSIKFLKQNKGSSADDDDDDDDDNNNGEEKNVKRYDEMSSFLSRSERTLSLPDMPPSEEELAQRRVKIVEQAKEVHNVEPMSAEEARAYYMNDEDFRRVDIDVELTTMRWEKAQKSKGIKFDETENPTRGLEEMLDTHKRRATLRKKHRKAVLEEMVRQKTSNNNSGKKRALDWDKIRAVAEPYSKETAQIAYEIALQDAGKPVPKKGKTSSDGTNKKKGGFFGLFKGKSKK